MHDENCGLTLTYSDDCLPANRWLVHRHFQLFAKRLRDARLRGALRKNPGLHLKDAPVQRYFMAGEYGEENGRPHYHAVMFGWSPLDSRFLKLSPAGSKLYTSEECDRLWKLGHCYVSEANHSYAAYIARYLLDVDKEAPNGLRQITDVDTGELYVRPNEYARMSNRPGIGFSWFQRYFSDVFPRDYVVWDGVKRPVPRYYKRLLERFSPLMLAELRARKREEMDDRIEKLTEDFPHLRYSDVRRLDVEERVKLAQIRSLKRE